METEIEMDMEAITAYQQVGSQRACPNAKTSFEWKKVRTVSRASNDRTIKSNANLLKNYF